MNRDKQYLHNMYNATSTDDGKDDLETYENWLEKQLLSRIRKIELLESKTKTLVDEAIMEYDLAIKRDLPNTFELLRDHGTHSVFCDKLNDIRNRIRK